MPRPAATSYRLGPETDARIAWLIQRLELSGADVIRQAVRSLYRAEGGPDPGAGKKTKKKPPAGIDTGNTSG